MNFELCLCYGLTEYLCPPPPPNSYVEALRPGEMVFGGGAFGKWLEHEDGALMSGISALIKAIPEK